MFERREIGIGQRYRDARVTAFGKPSRTVWMVERILGRDGLRHVRLVDERDPNRVKTIAAGALADRKSYVPLETGAGAVAGERAIERTAVQDPRRWLLINGSFLCTSHAGGGSAGFR